MFVRVNKSSALGIERFLETRLAGNRFAQERALIRELARKFGMRLS